MIKTLENECSKIARDPTRRNTAVTRMSAGIIPQQLTDIRCLSMTVDRSRVLYCILIEYPSIR